MANDSVLRIILARSVRSWRQQAAGSGALSAMSGRSAFRECATEIEEILKSRDSTEGFHIRQPDRTMEVRVFGSHDAMTEAALAAGREFFPGLEVTLSSLHVRTPMTTEERTKACTAGVPDRVGSARISARYAEGTCPQ